MENSAWKTSVILQVWEKDNLGSDKKKKIIDTHFLFYSHPVLMPKINIFNRKEN